ncbi:hypothetical protein F157LOC_01076 [Pectobacterium brasiliense]|uniref:hypothetical protein n=1 Tax=Pectobacterium brasiliense TaxID=180957 RepID=UPI000CE699F3|nr:hypothetical protein [Pectobacterium brasiliense]PPE62234.1 hypothetical protein F157LOC_01076 [Pectobacterium brasiliense]
MSFNALDPKSGMLQPIKWFIEHHLRTGICPVCCDTISVKADKAVKTSAHFAHEQGSPCPTVTGNRPRYENLGASQYDDDQAKVLRNAVSDNIYEIFITFQALAEGGKIQEFRDAMSKADILKIWRYAGLTLPFVPYILVTLVEQFNKKDSVFRNDDFFFILPSEVRVYDQLWIRGNVKKKVIKISKKFYVLDEFAIRDSLTPVLHPAWFDNSVATLTKQV